MEAFFKKGGKHPKKGKEKKRGDTPPPPPPQVHAVYSNTPSTLAGNSFFLYQVQIHDDDPAKRIDQYRANQVLARQ